MKTTDLWLLNESGLAVSGPSQHSCFLCVRAGEEDAGKGAKEEGSLVTKRACLSWGAARELVSLGKVSRDSFLSSPKDRTF